MPLRNYISTNAATLYINGWWLDDAVGIQYQVQDPKEPLYGYRDYLFRDVAVGNTIVHGMVDINFRYRGYFSILLSRIETLDAKLQEAKRSGDEELFGEFNALKNALNPRNNIRAAAIDPRSWSTEERAALLESPADTFDLRNFRRLAKAMQEDFWQTRAYSDRIEQTATERNRVGTWPDGFDISIVYNQDGTAQTLDPALEEKITNVRIVGQSKILQNNVPGGGEPLVERYQFIAKNVS